MELTELHLPADVQWVGLARLIVCRSAALAGMQAARVEDLRVAVSEATTNAIIAHERHGRADERVVLGFGADDDGEFQVYVRDAGAGFEPTTVDIETRDWTAESGLGITVLRALADSVAFERRDGMKVAMRFGLALTEPGGTDEAVAPPVWSERVADGTA